MYNRKEIEKNFRLMEYGIIKKFVLMKSNHNSEKHFKEFLDKNLVLVEFCLDWLKKYKNDNFISNLIKKLEKYKKLEKIINDKKY